MLKIQSNSNKFFLKLSAILLFLLFQPTSITFAQKTVNYIYDSSGQRIQSVSGGVTTTYPSKYYNIDSNGKVTKHIFAGDQLVATIEGTGPSATVKYIHTDNLGSTNVVTDDTGKVIENIDYYPYGSQRISNGTYTSQRQYIGQEYDELTKLNYLNARYYDSNRGQFISQDPVFWEIGQTKDGRKALLNPQTQNSYSYAGNNPVTYKDPDGRWYKELLTGQQSWSSFSGEVGQATQYMDGGWETAIGHPYVAGTAVGVVGGLAVYGTSAIITQAQVGVNLGRLSELPMNPRVDTLVEKGFNAIQKATGLSKGEAIQTIQNTGRSLVEMRPQNLGNINNLANVGEKIIRITTTPNATKIISSGVLGSTPKLQQYISSGAMQALPAISSVAKFITKLIK